MRPSSEYHPIGPVLGILARIWPGSAGSLEYWSPSDPGDESSRNSGLDGLDALSSTMITGTPVVVDDGGRRDVYSPPEVELQASSVLSHETADISMSRAIAHLNK